MHWCPDETAALFASIPLIGFAYRWIRAKLFGKKPIPECCEHPHEHGEEEALPSTERP